MKRPLLSAARLRDRSLVLTIATFIVFTPPVLTVFDVPILLFGVPLLHVYCFAVWLAAIVAGALLAPKLMRASDDEQLPRRHGSDGDGAGP
jgi:hypothetical protein